MDTKMNIQFLSTDPFSQADARVQWCMDNLFSSYDSKETICKIENNKLVIYGDIIISDEYEELPIKIDEVYGNVIVDNSKKLCYGKLKSLKNFPTIIHGKFDCRMNQKLETLEGGPEHVDGSYWCPGCNLKNLKGIAKYIGGYLLAYGNKIENMDDIKNSVIKQSIIINGNPLVIKQDPYYMFLLKKGKIEQ